MLPGMRKKGAAMRDYNAYALAAHRLCSELLAGHDDPGVDGKVLRMQERIRHSRLTVYQKEILLRELSSTHMDKHA